MAQLAITRTRVQSLEAGCGGKLGAGRQVQVDSWSPLSKSLCWAPYKSSVMGTLGGHSPRPRR